MHIFLRPRRQRAGITRFLGSVARERYQNFSFELKDLVERPKSMGNARIGILRTPHGNVETPNFVFCATKAAMKAVTPDQIRVEGTQFILSNTYHLMLTPGSDIVRDMGGLHKFMNWHGPMLTDSGGYQIFSMGFGSTLLQIDEDGATFRSYIDGTVHKLSPEKSISIQRDLGADLIVVLDECTPFNVDKSYTYESMLRSHRWADRCLREFDRSDDGSQALYGIVQGGVYEDLRKESCEYVNTTPFFGIAIGGSLGASKSSMRRVVEFTRSQLRNDRPIHLLGVGGVRDIFHGVRQGIDTFDCVHPTRLGRHGGALVKAAHWEETEKPKKLNQRIPREHINLTKARFRRDPRPIDEKCTCYTCRNFSRAYLHHLFKAKESLGGTLATIHNIHFMNSLMSDIRKAIASEGLGRVYENESEDQLTLSQVEHKYLHEQLRCSKGKEGEGEMFLGV
eukprot:GSChrysophyteH1.ASY1.ANO1.767.1 assembled CDS